MGAASAVSDRAVTRVPNSDGHKVGVVSEGDASPSRDFDSGLREHQTVIFIEGGVELVVDHTTRPEGGVTDTVISTGSSLRLGLVYGVNQLNRMFG